MKLRHDLTGQPFTDWTVLHRAPKKRGCDVLWLCQCVCGTLRPVRSWDLRSGRSKGCGCAHGEHTRQRFTVHGMRHSPEYAIWLAMKQRCSNPNDAFYHRYGGRGISVCQRWQDSFIAFYEDVGPRPHPDYTLERGNNDGPYSPENASWVPKEMQQRNTSANHMITIGDRTACLAEWYQITGLIPSTVKRRVKRGMSFEEALTMPPNPIKQTNLGHKLASSKVSA